MGKIISSAAEWNEHLSKDIYFSRDYHLSFETSMYRKALAYIHESGGESFFYPFMLGEIEKVGKQKPPKKSYDIETVYGYTGPLSTSASPAFLADAYQGFDEYCRNENIICEMIRFHPLLGNEKFKNAKTNISFNRNTVAISLSDKENLWKNYHPKLRNDINRAEKLSLEFSTEGKDFAQLYEATMKRINADEFYIFDKSHFAFCDKVFCVKDKGETIAAAIFLTYKDFIHYHLAASTDSPNQAYASKLLLHKTAEWAIDNGYKTFHLGGGRTAAEDDNLLFFKKRFGGELKDFYIGKTIFDQAAYDEICNLWRTQGGQAPASFLQQYRLPLS